jgi:hypothetical protein
MLENSRIDLTGAAYGKTYAEYDSKESGKRRLPEDFHLEF